MRSIPFGKPIIGQEEKEAVCRVLDSGILAHGPNVHAFEKAFSAFTGGGVSVSVSSCTAGLHLAYFAYGIGPGDEVIVPAETHVATAHAVELVGAKPVFVDAEAVTGNLDLGQVEAAITPRTKAISLVHFLGMPVDMKALMAIANRHHLRVIEDCALAIGSTVDGVHAGLFGDIGCFSFYPVKHITTAEGGIMLTRHAEVAERLTHLRAFGMDKHVGQRTVPGMYDVLELGYNYRLNDMQAALGIEQLKRLPEFLRLRRRNYDRLADGLRGVDGISLLASSNERLQSSYYCQTILLEEPFIELRLELITELRSRGVGTSIYYPQPVPHMTYYREKYGYTRELFPVAARLSYHSIALPVGPHVTDEDVDYIVTAVQESLTKVRP